MFYFYLLNALVIVALVSKGSFPSFNLMCQENYVHHSLLMSIWRYCTFVPPLLLLMTRHEKTQLKALP